MGLLVEGDAERACADLQSALMLDDQRPHLRPRALLEVIPKAEDRADGVDAPVARRCLEARVLAAAWIADVEDRPDTRRILVPAGQRSDHAVAGNEDEVLCVRALPQHELAPGEALVLGARGGEHAEHEDREIRGEAHVHLGGFP